MFTAKSNAVRIIERRGVCLEANPIADLANIHVNNRIGLTYYPNRSEALCERSQGECSAWNWNRDKRNQLKNKE